VLVAVVLEVAEQQDNQAVAEEELVSLVKEQVAVLDLHNKAGALEDLVVIMEQHRVLMMVVVVVVVAMVAVVAGPQTAPE
jgi:ABC-type enterobactin transport system permease subunit